MTGSRITYYDNNKYAKILKKKIYKNKNFKKTNHFLKVANKFTKESLYPLLFNFN